MTYYPISVFLLLTLAVSGQAVERRLSLSQALEEAGKLSPDVQLARLKALEAETATRITASAYKPQLSAAIGGAYQTINLQGIGLLLPGFSGRVGPFRTFNARPVFSQTVLDLSLLSRIRGARERQGEYRFQVETAREATQLAVVQIYLQILEAESRLSAAEARRDTAAAVLRQARDFFAAGTASKLDVARAEQQFHVEDASVTAARRDRDNLTIALARTIGLPPDESFHVEPFESGVASSSLQAASTPHRPELDAMDARLRAGEYERQAALRQRLPKLGFLGDYGASGAGPDRSLSTYNAGATLTIPLWTGGRIESEAQAARIRLEQARTERRAVELRIAQETAQARVDVTAAAETLKSAAAATAAAREALELARLRFSSGISTNVDVTVAQGVLAQAEDGEIRARYEQQLAHARLAYALGDIRALVR